MREIEVIKMNSVRMLEVTGQELKKINNPAISVGLYDSENTDFESTEIIGYVAGEIDVINTDPCADLWFINKDFFSKNYKEFEGKGII